MSNSKYDKLFIDENGEKVLGKWNQKTQRYILSNGLIRSKSWVNSNLDFVCRTTQPPRFRWERNINGFKTVKKVLSS